MSNNKSQISPIPPEGYGDRFVKFISGLTMTKEEQEREVETGEQLDGSTNTPVRHSNSFPISRLSNENKIFEKAEKQAHKTEKEGATEEPQRDRTLIAVRSPSAERSSGLQGATLPVVEEDGEGTSREDLAHHEKATGKLANNIARRIEQRPPPASEEAQNGRIPDDNQLPSIPSFNRLSMGMASTAVAPAGDR